MKVSVNWLAKKSFVIGSVLAFLMLGLVVQTQAVSFLKDYQTTTIQRGFPMPVFISSETYSNLSGKSVEHSSFDWVNMSINIFIWCALTIVVGWIVLKLLGRRENSRN